MRAAVPLTRSSPRPRWSMPLDRRGSIRSRPGRRCGPKSALHARHLIRFRRRFETVALRDAVPEILFLNSHDGTSAYQLRVGLYRAVCTNGLVVSQGTFPVFRVAHRGDVVADVVQAALRDQRALRGAGAARSNAWSARGWTIWSSSTLPAQALALRFPGGAESGVEPARLLVPRRLEDAGNDLWRTLNVVQENVLRGGIPRRSASNRLIRTRAITAIREDVRLNSGLWELALALAA